MSAGLCSRCGAVLPVVAPEGGDSACTECGLGFTTAPLMTARPPAPGERALSRAEIAAVLGPRKRAGLATWRGAAYGLDASWSGRRWLGGWGGHDGVTERLTLTHGDAWVDSAPIVRVETQRGRHARPEDAAQNLGHTLHHHTGVHNDAIRAAFNDPDWREVWDTTVISVDGVPVTFSSLTAGEHSIAVAEIGDAVVSIEARHVSLAALRLVPIEDLEPYLLDDGLPDER